MYGGTKRRKKRAERTESKRESRMPRTFSIQFRMMICCPRFEVFMHKGVLGSRWGAHDRPHPRICLYLFLKKTVLWREWTAKVDWKPVFCKTWEKRITSRQPWSHFTSTVWHKWVKNRFPSQNNIMNPVQMGLEGAVVRGSRGGTIAEVTRKYRIFKK